MKAINIKAYCEDSSQLNAIKSLMKTLKVKFEVSKIEESKYNEEFVSKIQKSRLEASEGKTVKIALDDVWK